MVPALLDRRRTLLVALAASLAAGALLSVWPPLPFALLVGGAAGLAVLRRPVRGLHLLVAVALLLPWAVLPVKLGLFLTFIDLALLAIFGTWLLVAVERSGQRRWHGTPIDGPVLVFLLLALVSFSFGLSFGELEKEVIRHFAEIMLAVLIYLAVVQLADRRRELVGLTRTFVVAGFGQAVLALVLYFLPPSLAVRLLSTLSVLHYPAGPAVLRYIEDNPELPMRAIGTAVDPNMLGGLLILVIGFTVPQLSLPRPVLDRRLLGVFLAVELAALFLTYSRGSFLGMAVPLLVYGLLRQRRLLLVLVALLVVLALLPPGQHYLGRLAEGLQGQDLATQMRFGEYSDALKLIRRYPWFGAGFVAPPDVDVYIGVSSIYLLLAEQMGLLGLGAFLTIMAIVLWTALGALRRGDPDGPGYGLLAGATLALSGALVGGIFDHYFMNLDFIPSVTLFWFTVGMVAAAPPARRRPGRPGR